jgi:hypothetical protein
MKQTTSPGAPAPIPYEEINPLISLSVGDTAIVTAALRFLAAAFTYVDTEEGIKLDYTEAWGLSSLLQTCAAALKVMNVEGRKA